MSASEIPRAVLPAGEPAARVRLPSSTPVEAAPVAADRDLLRAPLRGRLGAPPRPGRKRYLSSTIVAREHLSPADRERMLALMNVCYEGVERDHFNADLDAKQDVILLWNGRGRELVGFSTVKRTCELFEGRTVEIIFSGDTVIHPLHWGTKALQAAFSRHALARKLRHPGRPVYWFLLAGGYKTYVLMIHNLRRAWPRPESSPPPGWQAFVDDLAGRWFGSDYLPARGVVRPTKSRYRVRPGISPIDERAASTPEIAFFVRANPGHVDGDELVCLGELRLRDLVGVLGRAFKRRCQHLWSRKPLPPSRQGDA